jgi:hypothetical protein
VAEPTATFARITSRSYQAEQFASSQFRDNILMHDKPHPQTFQRKLFSRKNRVLQVAHLARQMAWRVRAEREGGLPEEIRQLALAIARDAPLRLRIESAAETMGADPDLYFFSHFLSAKPQGCAHSI